MMSMMQNKEVIENIGTALNALKRLRTSVGHVFTTLGNGAESESAVDDRETKLMLELQEQLNVVNGNLKDTEATINSLIVPGGAFTLSNTSLLSHETHAEKQSLYPQLLHSYKWNDKLANYSNNAVMVMGQNTLKRSSFNNNNKRRRPLSGNCNVSSQQFLQFVNSMNSQSMSVRVHQSFASSAIIHVLLGRVLKAAIIVKGYIIEWVCIKGFEESLENPDDHWSESRHAVFRKVQDHTHSALMHFYSPNIPELSLRSYLLWFRSYINLFVDPCKKCKRYLHNGLPPTWRDLRTVDTLHEECKH